MQEKIKQLLTKYHELGRAKLYNERRYEESLEYIVRALQCAELLEDWEEIVSNKIMLGNIYVNSSKDLNYAMKLYSDVLDLLENLQQRNIKLTRQYYYIAKIGLARALQELGKLDQVIPIIKEVIENIDDKRRIISALNDLGLIYWKKANFSQNEIFLDQALNAYGRALELCNSTGEVNEVSEHNDKAMVLNNMGIVYYDKHQYDLAIKSFEEALSLTVDEYYIACISNELAKTYIKLGNFHMAKKFINQANQILIDYDETVSETELLRNLAIEGLYQRKIGNFEDAVNYFEIAAPKLEDVELKIEAAETFHQLSLMLKEKGDIRSGRYSLKFEELAKDIEEHQKVLKS